MMKNKYFVSAVEWSETNKDNTGLPRPFAYTINKKRKDIKISKIVPIPWQSLARFNIGHLLGLNEKNEKRVFMEDLCGYCGIKIEKNENVSRWTNFKIFNNSKDKVLVFSDIHPFHIECMKQARIFCPFMKTVKEEEFEYGSFHILKEKAILDKYNIESRN
jgi:hypothetical protein